VTGATAPPAPAGIAAGRGRGVAAFAILLAAAAAIWGWKHRGGSVDMSLHYALVEYIRQGWAWPSLDVQHMGEMNHYPPGSHTIAALLAVAGGSSFLGLHLASVAAGIVAYASLLVLLRFTTPRATLIAAAALVAVLLAMARAHAALGREISQNFFYPQLVGTSCAFALVALRARLRFGAGAEIATALAATFLMGWIYPIGMVQLAGAAVAWRALLVARAWHETGRADAAAIASVPLLALGLVAAILLNPRFHVMASFAANEGWVALRIPGLLVIPATLLLGTAAALLGLACIRGRLRLVAPEAFVALCAGVAAASLAQTAAYFGLGSGSRYGVVKHIFAVSTLLAAAAVVGAIHLSRRAQAGSAEDARLVPYARLAFVPATLAAFLLSNNPWRGEPLPAALRVEAHMRALAREPGMLGHAVLLSGTAIDRFSFSMGLLHLPKEPSIDLIFRSHSTPERRRTVIAEVPVTYAFLSDGAAVDPACRMRTDAAARLMQVRLACDPQATERD